MPFIHRCAAAGWLEGVERCLVRGDSVDARGLRGWTVLHTAAAFARRDVVEMLLDAGADRTARDDFGCSVRWVAVSCGRDAELSDKLASLDLVLGQSARGDDEMSRLGAPAKLHVHLDPAEGLRALTKVALVLGKSARELAPAFKAQKPLATVDVLQMRRIAKAALAASFGLGWSRSPDPLLDTRCARSANVYFYLGETDPLTQRRLTPHSPPAWLARARPENLSGRVPG